MKDDVMNDSPSPDTREDMIADLGVTGREADQLRALLGEIAGLAHEVPEPVDDVRVLLSGTTPLRPRRRASLVAAAVGALALSGVSAAAAANRLPDHVQEVVADATGGVVPHPVKPTNPPDDAPGHVFKQDKHDDDDDDGGEPPGQIQKSTKPDPRAPGPASPADPGSHGRAHNDSGNGGDKRDEDD
jgi:hypothetical protein